MQRNSIKLTLIDAKISRMLSFALLACIALSCSRIDSTELTELIKNTDVEYQSANIEIAESVLIRFRDKLMGWEANGVAGIDYEHMFGIVNARLWHIYEYMDDEDRLVIAFRSATNHLTRARVAHGGEPKTYTREDVLHIVELADKKLNVKWKKVPLNKRELRNE